MDPLGYSTGKHGGSIREAGGAMGSMAAAKEELYFRQEDEKKFQKLREEMDKKQQASNAPQQSNADNKH